MCIAKINGLLLLPHSTWLAPTLFLAEKNPTKEEVFPCFNSTFFHRARFDSGFSLLGAQKMLPQTVKQGDFSSIFCTHFSLFSAMHLTAREGRKCKGLFQTLIEKLTAINGKSRFPRKKEYFFFSSLISKHCWFPRKSCVSANSSQNGWRHTGFQSPLLLLIMMIFETSCLVRVYISKSFFFNLFSPQNINF